MELRTDGRKLSHEVLEIYRLRAIELRKAGKSVKEIAFFFGLHPNSVSRWFVKHKRGGIAALKRRKAPGPSPKLKLDEVLRILDCLKRPATDYGFPSPLWTCKWVGILIKQETGKSFTVVGVWKLLRRLGLTSKKPEQRAAEQSPRDARKWMREEWPKILANARRWQAPLYFQDETWISLTPSVGRTWAPRGEIPVIRVTGRRGGFCINSAISLGGRILFRVEGKSLTSKTFVDFLEKLMQHHPRKLVVVTDQAPIHVARRVKEFVEANKQKFALYYLPPYSPGSTRRKGFGPISKRTGSWPTPVLLCTSSREKCFRPCWPCKRRNHWVNHSSLVI